MKIILTRHGRTVENDAGILQGHLPGRLNEKGFSQARKLSLRLAGETIDHAYSSDLARSADTAREIMKYHPWIPLELVPELRETHLGEWQGKTKAELGLVGNPQKEAEGPKDGETLEAIEERAASFVEAIASRHPDETVLLVGHSGINRRIVRAILRDGSDVHTGNASVSVFEIGRRRDAVTLLLDCREHLEGEE